MTTESSVLDDVDDLGDALSSLWENLFDWQKEEILEHLEKDKEKERSA